MVWNSSMPLGVGSKSSGQAPKGYSLIEVHQKSGEVISVTMQVNPAYTSVMQSAMKDGFLSLHNDREGILLRTEDIAMIRITKITTE